MAAAVINQAGLMRPRTVAELRAEARALWRQAAELERWELEYGPAAAQQIVMAVGAHYHVSTDRIKGKLRLNHVAAARHCTMWMLRELTTLSLSKIGLVLNRDHSTVYTGIESITRRMLTSPPFASELCRLRERIRLMLVAPDNGMESAIASASPVLVESTHQ